MKRISANKIVFGLLAAAALLSALGLQAEEVTYSNLEVKLTGPPVRPQAVQLAAHSEPLVNPAQADFELPPPNAAPVPASPSQPLMIQEAPIYVSPDGCADCIGPEYWEFNPWYAGVDLLLFRPSYTTSLASTYPNSFTFSEDEGFAALRPYVGWESLEGIGVRFRGWGFSDEYDLETDRRDDFLTRKFKFEAATIDIDLYKRISFSRTQLVVGGGVKAAYELIDYDISPLINIAIPHERTTATSGVSTFLEVRHVFCSTEVSEWSMIGRGRLGALSGRYEYRDRGQRLYEGADAMLTVEGAIGLEYLRHFKHHDFVFQYLAESQTWDSDQLGKLGFDGASLRFGFQW
jgi:hypothetical protein